MLGGFSNPMLSANQGSDNGEKCLTREAIAQL
jgi:hypothetical protein